jgi:hypothetical protein
MLTLVLMTVGTVAVFTLLRPSVCRRYDLKLLWPALKAKAVDLEQARCAMLIHMANDPAWNRRFQNEDELGDFVRKVLV